MTILLLLITASYFILIGSFAFGYFKLKPFSSDENLNKNCFSILIPFRNEVLNLPNLLESISKLNYPKELFEILLINDDSEDDYLPIINAFKKGNPTIQIIVIENVRKSKAPKKDAVSTGVLSSKFEWILTTDADCILPRNWITCYNNFIETHDSIFIAGPVSIKQSSNWFSKFQLIDFSSLIGCTIGAFGIRKPFMCNGANICYQKEIFIKLNGYDGNNHIASGDDIFLLEKMNQYDSNRVQYLKSHEALVRTSAQPTIKELVNQRVRWASKTTTYTNNYSKLVGIIVLLMNLVFTIILLLSTLHLSLNSLFISILLSKVIIDSCIIIPFLNFTKTKYYFLFYLLIMWVHPIFLSFIAILSLFKKEYHWKNRNF